MGGIWVELSVDPTYYRGFNLQKLTEEDEVVAFIEALSYCEKNHTNRIGPYRWRKNCNDATNVLAIHLKIRNFSIGGGHLASIIKKYSQQGSKKKFFHVQKKRKEHSQFTPRPIYVNCKKLKKELETRRIEHAKYEDKIFISKHRKIDEEPIKVSDKVSCQVIYANGKKSPVY